jgi:hypothetical protein
MQMRHDWRKYHSETQKYDPLILAAEKRDDEFEVTSQWSFNVLGAEQETLAEVEFGWGGIEPEKSCPSVNELIVSLEDDGFADFVTEKITSLYFDLPWVPVLPVRILPIDKFYEVRLLPHLDGWYDPDTGKIHYCHAYQIATGMPVLKSICGKMESAYYYFRDPIPYVEPEFSADVCKNCQRAGAKIEVKETHTYSGSIEVRIHLSNGETYTDFIDRIEAQIQFYKEESASIDYIHVDVIGASWSLLAAHECAQQIRRYCQEHFSKVETYVTYW